MPVIGLGTGSYGTGAPAWTDGEYWNDTVADAAVFEWLAAGGRRIDTSRVTYHDLLGVVRAVARSPVPRGDIFVTSKINTPYGYNETKAHLAELRRTMAGNGTVPVPTGEAYVDLLLIHWPGPFVYPGHTSKPQYCHTHGRECRQGTWRALTEAFESGFARSIGVANFEKPHLQDIIDMGGLLPAVNQFEYHPYWHEDDLQAFCRGLNITVNGYAPLGAPDHMAYHRSQWPVLIPDQPLVKAIASKRGITPAQVILRWELQRRIVINPRSWNVQHMRDNLEAASSSDPKFQLSNAEMTAIDALPKPAAGQNKVTPDPHTIP